MIAEGRQKIGAAVAAYREEDAATRDVFEAADTLIAALNRLREQNATAGQRTRVAYSFKGAMTQGGSDATRAHDQIRNIIENQLRAALAIRADVERVFPLLDMNSSIAERMLGVLGS